MVVEAVGMIFASTFDLFRCAPGCGMVDRRGRDSPSRLLTFSPPFSGRCFLASPHPQRAFLCYHGRRYVFTCSTFGSTGACRGPMRENEKGRATP